MFSNIPENKENKHLLPQLPLPLIEIQLPLIEIERPQPLLTHLFKMPIRECKNPSLENEKMTSLGRLPSALWLAVSAYLDLASLTKWIRSCKKLIQIGNHNSLRTRLYEAKTNRETRRRFTSSFLGLVQPEAQRSQEMQRTLNSLGYLQLNDPQRSFSEDETHLYNDNPISGFIMKKPSS